MSRFRIFKWNEALGFRIEESRELLPQEARTNPLPSVIRLRNLSPLDHCSRTTPPPDAEPVNR